MGTFRVGLLKVFAICAWSLAVCAGYTLFIAHHLSADESLLPPAHYPVDAPAPVAGRPTLLMFIHAKCPCTRASLDKLEALMRERTGQLSAHVFAIEPKDAEADWFEDGNWEIAAGIPGVTLHLDPEGRMARQLQAATSGATVVYDRRGALAFVGGLTAQRGHAGPSSGEDAVRRIMRGEALGAPRMPVFGCALFDHATTGGANT